MMELFFFLSLFPVAVEEFAVVSNVSPSSFFREFKKDKFVWRVPHVNVPYYPSGQTVFIILPLETC